MSGKTAIRSNPTHDIDFKCSFRKPGDATAFTNFKKITEAYWDIVQGTKAQVNNKKIGKFLENETICKNLSKVLCTFVRHSIREGDFIFLIFSYFLQWAWGLVDPLAL